VRLRARVTLRGGLVGAMGLCLAAYLGALALESHLPDQLVNVWLPGRVDQDGPEDAGRPA
jgi:hypothetical protein